MHTCTHQHIHNLYVSIYVAYVRIIILRVHDNNYYNSRDVYDNLYVTGSVKTCIFYMPLQE